MLASDHRWRPATDLIWTRFEDSDDWVVYHPASGGVHVVTSSAQLLWRLASDGTPRTIEQLASVLSDNPSPKQDDALVQATQQMLQFMDDAGLLYPVEASS